MNPLAFLLLCLAGWMNRNQQDAIEYLPEEISVLKELLGKAIKGLLPPDARTVARCATANLPLESRS
jgi:hypothetical protein